MPVDQVFDTVLYILFQWGFIQALRFDNGRPFGDPTRQSLSPCAMRLIAMGIQVIFNPARSPKRNSKVERTQGTTCRWADPGQSANLEEFQKNLDFAVIAQRELLPTRVCNGQTRIQKYPGLLRNMRKYDPTDFDVQRLYDFLAKGVWKRTVSTQGVASVFGKDYQVGYASRKSEVTVRFDPQQRAWQFYDEENNLLKTFKAKGMDHQNILCLSP